jgi:hypothetical protein
LRGTTVVLSNPVRVGAAPAAPVPAPAVIN